MKTITIAFQNDDDAARFLQYKEKADAQEGTVSPLYSGLTCAAIKRARIIKPKVAIEVNGGCAECTLVHGGVKVEIIDHDNEKVGN